jgi:hypothetical protein
LQQTLLVWQQEDLLEAVEVLRWQEDLLEAVEVLRWQEDLLEAVEVLRWQEDLLEAVEVLRWQEDLLEPVEVLRWQEDLLEPVEVHQEVGEVGYWRRREWAFREGKHCTIPRSLNFWRRHKRFGRGRR